MRFDEPYRRSFANSIAGDWANDARRSKARSGQHSDGKLARCLVERGEVIARVNGLSTKSMSGGGEGELCLQETCRPR